MRRLVLAALAVAALAAAGAPLAVETLDGEPVALAEGAQPLVVHFWATWCPSCGAELAGLSRAAEACAGAVRVVTVAVSEPPDAVRAFAAGHGITLELLRDPAGDAWRSVTRAGLPANLVWDGRERRVSVGPRSAEEWARELTALGCRGAPPPAR